MTKRLCAALMVTGLVLAGCGGGTKGNNTAAANKSAPPAASNSQNAAAPTANAAQAATPPLAARVVRIGIDGEHDLDACHTGGRLKGSGKIAIRNAPDAGATQVEEGSAGMLADQCETVPGWVGIVWQGEGEPDRDCGLGANLPGPQPYSGPCRSGWVAEANFEVTAG